MTVYSAIALALALQTAPEAATAPTSAQITETTDDSDLAALQDADSEAAPSEARPTILVTVPQPLVLVRTAVTPDTEFRTVDHGQIISSQDISPAQFVTITTPVNNANKYGPAGASLWKYLVGDKEWWCWRNTAGFPAWNRPTDFYCYNDTDGDGTFDELRENPGWSSSIRHSRFIATTLGTVERARGKASYIAGGQLDYVEQVAIRYDAPIFGSVNADGIITKGAVSFDVIAGVGPQAAQPSSSLLYARLVDPAGMDKLFSIPVALDENGKGKTEHPSGISIEVERANADGTVVMKLLSGYPTGEASLMPPIPRLSFESLLQILQARGDI
ncbi:MULTISPECIES: hypothetical protein [unclassified Brevundimonas]|uniref:hypothetical protein n=1 Tax=unclassified Brevundimonas TaxID=2622653 RepID=UPI0025BA50AA|nr:MULTISPECIES: hypothetical protein [unclassified Brevundimonas]